MQLVNNPQRSEFSNLRPSHVRRDTIVEKVGSSGCLSLGGKSFFLPALHAMSLSVSHFCPLTHPLCTHSTRGEGNRRQMSRAGRSPRSRPQNPKEGGNLSDSNQPDGGGVGRGGWGGSVSGGRFGSPGQRRLLSRGGADEFVMKTVLSIITSDVHLLRVVGGGGWGVGC